MEPSPKTFEEIGRLCAAWSYLESTSEHTLWGILGADERWGQIVSARQDLQGFWKLILEHAQTSLNVNDIQELREINKLITTVATDRNIIVHGHIIAMVKESDVLGLKTYAKYAPVGTPLNFERLPCWVVFKGAPARKNHPISTRAAEIVRTNIQKLASRVENFNKRYGHYKGRKASDEIVSAWPVPLE